MFVKVNQDNSLVFPYSTSKLKHDNPNVSFKSNIEQDAASLAEFGVFPVQQEAQPTYDKESQKIELNSLPNNIEGNWVLGWSIVELTPEQKVQFLDERKSGLLADATATRYDKEASHPTIDTSIASQNRITSVLSDMGRNPNRVVNFKQKDGTWAQVDKAALEATATAIADWVQACFDNEKALHEAINAATTQAELDAIDLNAGWPVA